jgi:hypothetical protein
MWREILSISRVRALLTFARIPSLAYWPPTVGLIHPAKLDADGGRKIKSGKHARISEISTRLHSKNQRVKKLSLKNTNFFSKKHILIVRYKIEVH